MRVEEELAAVAGEAGTTEFVGYQTLESDGRLLALIGPGGREPVATEGEEVRFVLDRTPFYAESGGQVGDQGLVRAPGGTIAVTDAQFGPGGIIVHTGVVGSGEIREGEEVHGEVDAARREATARAHTATHILHWTLRHVLGDHARQAGSLVAPGRLRFDFPHHSAVPHDVLEQAEELANRRLAEDGQVTIYETTMDEAKNQGAIALFGEKYGDFVRVVEVGDYSIELCGGTHVHHTGEIALVRILHEASIGAGMRRVEALVGPDALREINMERDLLYAIARELGTDPKGALERARQYAERVKQLESELGKQAKQELKDRAEQLASGARVVEGAKLVTATVDADADELRVLAQDVANRLEGPDGAAVVLGTGQGGKALLVAASTKNLIGRGRDRAGAARTGGEDRRRGCGRQAEPRVLRRPEGGRVPGGPRCGRTPSEGTAPVWWVSPAGSSGSISGTRGSAWRSRMTPGGWRYRSAPSGRVRRRTFARSPTSSENTASRSSSSAIRCCSRGRRGSGRTTPSGSRRR